MYHILPAIISCEFFTFSVSFKYSIFTNTDYVEIQKRNKLLLHSFSPLKELNLHENHLKINNLHIIKFNKLI